MARDVAVVVPNLSTAAMQWWARDCLPALASDPRYNVVLACEQPPPADARAGAVLVPVEKVASFIGHGHAPALVEVDGASAGVKWCSQPYRHITAAVDTDAPGADWHPPPVAPMRVDFRPRAFGMRGAAKGGHAVTWRGDAEPGVLFEAMMRGAVVFTTVRDRWTRFVDGCSVYVNPAVEPLGPAVVEFLSDREECYRLTRLARERAEAMTAERFVQSFEEACR